MNGIFIRFTLVTAENPCPCGFFGDPVKECTCLPAQVTRYQKRLSGPILDRIDIFVNVLAVKTSELMKLPAGESSKEIQRRVQKARDIQVKRFKKAGILANAEMSSKQVKDFCNLDEESKQLIARAISQLQLSARGYTRVLKVARTIADLSASQNITSAHLAEALQYRAS